MDHVKQLHRGAGFVGLQRPKQVQLNTRIGLLPRGPLVLGFLHAVFTENPVAFLQNRLDPLRRLDLGHGD